MITTISKRLPIELCHVIQSYQTDVLITQKMKLFKKLHKDIKVVCDRLTFYEELIKDKPNKIEWVCRLIYINKVLFAQDNHPTETQEKSEAMFYYSPKTESYIPNSK